MKENINKPERITTMKKSSLQSIVNYIDTNAVAELADVRDEIVAELNKGAEKAQANRDLYDKAHDVVIKAMSKLTAPAPISEIFAEVENALPEGMTKGKFQYAVTRLWVDEIVKTEGKVNAYSLKA